MKVKQLIEELSKQDPDATVWYIDTYFMGTNACSSVEVTDHGVELLFQGADLDHLLSQGKTP